MNPSDNTARQSTTGQDFWSLCRHTLLLYKKHGISMTRVLVWPTLQIMLGAYGCLALSYVFINAAATTYRAIFVEQYLWLTFVILALIFVLTMGPFFRGFWQYLIYMASLNLNVAEALENRPIDCKAAYQAITSEKEKPYFAMLLAYFVAFVAGSVPFMLIAPLVAIAKVMGAFPEWLGNIAYLLLLLPALAVWILLTFTFQIVAFKPVSKNPLHILKRSVTLVWTRPIATTGFQILLLALTSTLIPLPIAWFLRLTRLSTPLDWFHTWMLRLVLEGTAPANDAWSTIPNYMELYGQIEGQIGDIAKYLTESCIVSLVMGLLLPLGTIAFSLLYRDLTQQSTQTDP